MKALTDKLTYANVMSTIAVFLLLAGGGAWAAKKLIKGKQIKNGAINTKKLKNGAVTEPKVGQQAIDTGNLVDKAAKQGKIGQNAIITEKLADEAVNTEKLGDGAVTPGKTNFAVTSGRVVSNPIASQELITTLFTIGGVTVSGVCREDAGGTMHSAFIEISGPANSFFSGVTGGTPPTTSGGALLGDLNGIDPSATQLGVSVSFDVMTPTNHLSGQGFVAVNTQGSDCVFGANGLFG